METGMKGKSKLTRLTLALVMRQALILLLIAPISTLAATEANQEIGVPQPMEVAAKGCAAAVLLPEIGQIYSVYEGVLTRYQINPFKRIGSTVIDWGRLKDKLDTKGCSLAITNDKSRFVLVHRDQIALLDASTGQILNRVERKSDRLGPAILNDADLITLDSVVDRCFDDGCTRYFNLTIWDANTLQAKREIRDLGSRFGFFWDQHSGPILSTSPGRIYMTTDQSLVVLNSKNYAPELTLFRPGVYDIADIPKLSKDFQKLAMRGVAKVTDHLTGKTASYDDVSRDRVLIFDQATREFCLETKEFGRESSEQISGVEYVSFRGRNLHISRSKEYFMSMAIPGAGALLANLSAGTRVIFRQYESSEAVLMNYSSKDGLSYFQLTPGARTYLMMKNSAGKTVPINDATFVKYNKTETAR
jgi:hypothetical protein